MILSLGKIARVRRWKPRIAQFLSALFSHGCVEDSQFYFLFFYFFFFILNLLPLRIMDSCPAWSPLHRRLALCMRQQPSNRPLNAADPCITDYMTRSLACGVPGLPTAMKRPWPNCFCWGVCLRWVAVWKLIALLSPIGGAVICSTFLQFTSPFALSRSRLHGWLKLRFFLPTTCKAASSIASCKHCRFYFGLPGRQLPC